RCTSTTPTRFPRATPPPSPPPPRPTRCRTRSPAPGFKHVCALRLRRQRAVVARQRLLKPLQPPQRKAAVEGLRIVGLERDRLVVARQRVVEPLQLLERNAAVVVRRRSFGIYL